MPITAESLSARMRANWMASVPTTQFDATWITRLCEAVAHAVVDEFHANGTIADVAKKGIEATTTLVIR